MINSYLFLTSTASHLLEMNQSYVQLHEEWMLHLGKEFDLPYMCQLAQFLRDEKAMGKSIYPQRKSIFAALDKTPLSKVKAVILGQDPYHGAGQAHGLSFSVPDGMPVPPSLKNIYKEISQDLKIVAPSHGNLEPWTHQGVLLLNSVLTVEDGQAASHKGKGWENFTDRIIATISERTSNVVFLLWGAYAQKKGAMIDRSRHLVLQSPHPSPLSAHRGFLGCRHFSQTNDYLLANGKSAIKWEIS